MKAWGFTYRTNAAWEKNGLGLGYYFRQNHEMLLVATKGSSGIPASPDRVASVMHARKGHHSAKPAMVYEMLEGVYPHARRLEMFARDARADWTAWGNEVKE